MINLIISLLFLTAVPQNDLRIEAGNSISAFFGKNVKMEFEKVTLPAEIKTEVEKSAGQRFFKDFLYRWKIYENNELTALAYMDNVYGKTMPITFLLIINLKGEVLNSEIVKYREQYGGGVGEKSWLNQFKGKNEKAPLKSGEDISTISGATISSKSVTAGIKKILLINKALNKQ